MTTSGYKVAKLVVACLICLAAITAIVLLAQHLRGS
jgi:hypothetical protein